MIYEYVNILVPVIILSMIAIIGGGIIGLSIGWFLARKGEDVTIFEKGVAGRGATWASAGMLAPNLEAEPSEEKLLPLLLRAREMWEEFSKELEHSSGMDVGYRKEGALAVALNRDDLERLKFQYTFQKDLGLDVKWLNGEEVLDMEQYITRNVLAALFSPSDHQVDSRKVTEALRTAFVRSGGLLKENTEVMEVVVEQEKVRGLVTSSGKMEVEKVVLAAGAWSRKIAGIPDYLKPPVRPVKGQMLSLRMDSSNPVLNHVVWGPPRTWGVVYFVPRLDGRLLIGSTVEEMGFDTKVTAGAMMNILRGAWEVIPAIHDLPVEETWAGLRPGSRDDAPILGPTPIKGLIMATGHFRNGILLAPITAEAITEYILEEELPELVRPFTIYRFTEKERGVLA